VPGVEAIKKGWPAAPSTSTGVASLPRVTEKRSKPHQTRNLADSATFEATNVVCLPKKVGVAAPPRPILIAEPLAVKKAGCTNGQFNAAMTLNFSSI
jgi:hypothetical protein